MRQLLILAMLIACTGLIAEVGVNSFRHRSTCGALDDDLEYAFDPVDLYHFQGSKFFSSLNNIDSEDRLLMNSGGNSLLLGAATDDAFFENLKAAVLFTYYDNRYAQPFEYYADPYGEITQTGYGEGEYFWQSYFDNNDNGLYDTYQTMRQRFDSSGRQQGNSQFLVLNYALTERSALGFKIGQRNFGWSDTNASSTLLDFEEGSPSQDYHYTNESLADMDPSVPFFHDETLAQGDFGYGYSHSEYLSELGYTRYCENGEASLLWSFNYLKRKEFIDDSAYIIEREYHSDEGGEEDVIEYSADESQKQDESDGGIANRLSGRLRKTLIPGPDLRRSGYWSLGLGVGLRNLGADYSEKYRFQENVPQNNFEWTLEDYQVDGGILGLGFNGFLRLNYPLNENTFLGAGILYDHNRDKLTGDFDYKYTEIDTTFAGDDKDWVATAVSTSHSQGDVEELDCRGTLTVPVGLEYWFGKDRKWAMRVGTVFTQIYSTTNQSYQYTLIEPTLVQETDADDPDNPYSYNEDNTCLMESSSYKYKESTTDYCYGLCYQANDNLQIELMGMFDEYDINLWNTDFFRNLRFAFTVSF